MIPASIATSNTCRRPASVLLYRVEEATLRNLRAHSVQSVFVMRRNSRSPSPGQLLSHDVNTCFQ